MIENNICFYNNKYNNIIYSHLSETYCADSVTIDTRFRKWLGRDITLDGIRDPSDPNYVRFAVFKESKSGSGIWTVDYTGIFDYCIKKFAVLNVRDRCFIYDDAEGIYRENQNDIEKTISQGLDVCGFAKKNKIEPIVTEMMKRVKRENRCSDNPFNLRVDLIPCNNGVYNIQTKRLEPYSPLHGFTYKFPTDYNPDIDIQPMLDYIRGLVKEEDVCLIFQMLSSIAIRDHNKRLYLIYNLTGNNGKSTFLNLVRNTVGEKNVSTLSPQEITNGVFNSAELEGKVVNIASDIEEKAIYNTAIIKQLTGYDSIYAQRKYGQPFSFIYRGVCIWGCNTPPRIIDNSDAFNRRLVLIEFPHEFKQDSRFADTMTSDRRNQEALLKIAIENIPNLLDNGVIDTDIQETRHRLQMSSDSVYAFVSDRMERDDRYAIVDPDPNDIDDLYDPSINFRNVHTKYKEYCNEKKFKRSLGLNKFKDALGDHCIHVIYRGPSGNQTALVIGARLKNKTIDLTNASLSRFVECPA